MFYKDVAPLALEGSAGFSPLERAMGYDVRFCGRLGFEGGEAA